MYIYTPSSLGPGPGVIIMLLLAVACFARWLEAVPDAGEDVTRAAWKFVHEERARARKFDRRGEA